jgi:G3E family GTPase
MDKINSWLGKTLRTKGNDIFRMKGVIAIKGWKEKFVFHGVHMMVRLTALSLKNAHARTLNNSD